MKKKMVWLFATVLTVCMTLSASSISMAVSVPTAVPTAAPGITVEDVDRGWTIDDWKNYVAETDSAHNAGEVAQTNTIVETPTVEEIDRGWTVDDWKDYVARTELITPTVVVNGHDLLLRGTKIPTKFYDTNKSSYTESMEDIMFLQTVYTDYYFPSGPNNKLYLFGTVRLEDANDNRDIRLELYEYSPNQGVYGTEVSFTYLYTTSTADGNKAIYGLNKAIGNLQPNNLYYFKFVNDSGRTAETVFYEISGNPIND